MTYIIADIHGCFDEYKKLLEKINFSDSDEMFILGDAMDRGKDSIKVIKDIMSRHNVTYILGNHDYMMMCALENLCVEITDESIKNLTEQAMLSYYDWLEEGGSNTAKQFAELNKNERADIIDYLKSASLYETVDNDGVLYILVHAGLSDFDINKEMDEYDAYGFLWERTDYSRNYFESDKIKLVTGHTPTALIRPDRKPLVFQENGHIALDCGCVFGGNLAAYCIETGEITYVEKIK